MIRRMRRTKPAVTRGHGSRRLCNASDTLTDFGERGRYALFQEKVYENSSPWAIRSMKYDFEESRAFFYPMMRI